MAEKVVGVNLVARTGAYVAQMRQAAAANTTFGASTRAPAAQAGTMMTRMKGVASAGGMISPALLGAGGAVMAIKSVVGAAVEWESAFAGVQKTVNGTTAELAAIEGGLRDMSTEIPTSAEGLASIAESAGQLGIETGRVLEFTRTMADLGEATNMSSEQAATALARLANITQMPQEEFDRLGSTVVELGNNMATTEGEIVEMGLRLAGAGSQVGMAESEIMALAGALSSVGIQAQAGGTAMSKVMIEMANAASSGGEKLEQFAEIAGVSGDRFASMFEEDPTGAIVAFVEGLGRASDAGENLFQILGDLGIEEIRMRDALLRTAGAGDVLRDAIEMGNSAWEENIALTEEANRRYETTASQWQILKNNVSEASRTFGGELKPAVDGVIGALSSMFGAINETNDALGMIDEGGISRWKMVTMILLDPRQAITTGKRTLADEMLRTAEIAAVAEGDVHQLTLRHQYMSGAATEAAGATDDVTVSMEQSATAAYRNADGVYELSENLDALVGINLSVEQAVLRTAQGWDDLTEALTENGSTLDLNTEKGRANREAILSQASAIMDEVQARYDQGESIGSILARYDEQVSSLREVMSQAGLTEAEIDRYIDKLGLTPDRVVTDILANTDDANSRLDYLQSRLNRMNGSRYTVWMDQKYGATVRVPGGGRILERAGGGYTPPGMTIVGENGPEAVEFPRSGYVHTAPVTASMMGRQAGGGGPNISIHVAGSVVSERELVDTVRRGLTRHNARNGA